MSLPRSLARRALAALSRHAASSYVAGPRLADALGWAARLRGEGAACTLGYWNRPGEDPELITRECLGAIEEGARGALDCVVAVKAAPLGFDGERFARLLACARRHGVRLVLDAMRWEAAEATVGLAVEAALRGHDVGVALPARWRRSLADAGTAIRHGLAVRIVKGEWPDPAGDREIEAGFVALAERLAGRARQVGVATHDPALAREALRRLLARDTDCEQELLFGLPMRECARAARELGVGVRVYVPYGEPCLPYSLAAARGDATIAARALRDLWPAREARLRIS